MELEKSILFQSTPTAETQRKLMLDYFRANGRVNVKALLVACNIRQVAIADKHQFHRADVNKVILGKRRTRKIRQAIADELGLAFDEVWGVKF